MKFKTIRHTMVSDCVLPSKTRLIKLCKTTYKIDHSSLKLTGIESFKDRVILAIFMGAILDKQNEEGVSDNSTIPDDPIIKFREIIKDRQIYLDEFTKLAPQQNQEKPGKKKIES